LFQEYDELTESTVLQLINPIVVPLPVLAFKREHILFKCAREQGLTRRGITYFK
jgi:hypothetical protein